MRLSFEGSSAATSRSGSKVHDAAGSGNDGTVAVASGGKISLVDSGSTGHGAAYPRGCLWKLQVDGYAGKPSCVISGTKSRVILWSNLSVADGAWHLVKRLRIGREVTLSIDGVVPARVAGMYVRIRDVSYEEMTFAPAEPTGTSSASISAAIASANADGRVG